jgi:hypothetical protein
LSYSETHVTCWRTPCDAMGSSARIRCRADRRRFVDKSVRACGLCLTSVLRVWIPQTLQQAFNNLGHKYVEGCWIPQIPTNTHKCTPTHKRTHRLVHSIGLVQPTSSPANFPTADSGLSLRRGWSRKTLDQTLRMRSSLDQMCLSEGPDES